MAEVTSPYKMRPPVLQVHVEDAMDIMIVRDTVRRAAGLLGFSPAHRAQLASAAATLAELVLKTGEAHTLHLNGVIKGARVGLQISLKRRGWPASARTTCWWRSSPKWATS